ncbi:MAG: hypothetical protein U9O96_00910 [Candidatus Thermoplasmatota archaeon]|nr:hypothetical protein [Candidatus Thermoplasmatota archaeon]
MVKKEELRQNWEKINSQLEEAERFLKEGKLDEGLYFIWLAAENIVNNLKVAINGFYLKDHKAKTDILKDYFATGALKKDYSKTFEKLSKYRIVAEFHPYTSIPKDYMEKDVLNFLREIQELRREVEKFLIEKGILK